MIDFTKFRSTSLGFRVTTLFRANACLLEKRLAEIGICFGQAPYVIATNEKEGQTQDELAARIRVNRAATARHLKSMEQSDLIIRKENPENRRQKLVYPTDKSRAIIDDLIHILETHNESVLKGFSEEELSQLLSLLDRAVANVDAMRAEGGCDEHS